MPQYDDYEKGNTQNSLDMAAAFMQIAAAKWKQGKSASNVRAEVACAEHHLRIAVARLEVHMGD